MPDWAAVRAKARQRLAEVGQRLVKRPLATLVVLASVVAAIALLIGSYPGELPAKKNPGFIDNIFASRFVVFAARLALVALAAYVIASMAALTLARRWVTQVGPGGVKASEISESVGKYEVENRALRRDLEDARGTIDELQERLRESDLALQEASSDIELLVRRIDILDEKPQREPGPDDA